jgi:transcriptional/translational regulatory protein YebC/TACO1
VSGHSKWATTKHKKAAIDAKRGKLFAKLIKNIEVAAQEWRTGPRLATRLSSTPMQKAKKNSVPADNIDRAVKRGGGLDGSGVDYETIMYEGYAAGRCGPADRMSDR